MGKVVTETEVIERIKAVHGDTYGFNNFKYTRMHDHTFLTCKKHGDFKITPNKAIIGRGCRDCADEAKAVLFRRPLKDFIRDARRAHGNQYIYRGFVEIVNNNTPVTMFCRACKKPVKQRINEHLQGKHHSRCVNVKKRPITKKNYNSEMKSAQARNSKNMEEWKYTEDWDEKTLLDGSYAAFVYQFIFEDGSHYIGVKQLYQRVKTYKKIKEDSKENNWRNYSSSSKIVNQKIADGENYTRTILWAFPTMDEALLVETSLILSEGLKHGSLNLAVMHKCKLPNAEGKKRIYGILQQLWEWLN